MEVKINREIRNYTEGIFFGLSLRQFIFSVLACAAAVAVYFGLEPYFEKETVSWICILAAAPFAGAGFIKYNGMTLERFLWAWFKSEILTPKHLSYHAINIYEVLIKESRDAQAKAEKEKHKFKIRKINMKTGNEKEEIVDENHSRSIEKG